MKNLLIILIFTLIFPVSVRANSFDISSEYVYFYNYDKNEIIYEQNKAVEISIASLTKIMTAFVAIENIKDLDAEIVLTVNDFKGLKEANASTAGFKIGEKVTYRDLLYGLMLPSGADAALALSNNVAGSEEKFVILMNKKANELNLEHTNFVNTTGLDVKNQFSTVEDVAKILLMALENPEFHEIFTTGRYVTSNKRITFRNKVINDSILGSKAGYTYDAGLCLASISENKGNRYLLITAGADYKTGKPNHVYDTTTIYSYFFEKYEYKNILTKGDFIVSISTEDEKKIDFFVPYTKEVYAPINSEIVSNYNGADLITYDMKTGDKIGSYNIYINGDLIESIDIILKEELDKPNLPIGLYVIGGIFCIFIITLIIFISKRKTIQ
jgi:D-alanyl-D-alanine carboxypeptidase